MTLQTTFYLSQILGKRFFSPQGMVLGKVYDLLVDQGTTPGTEQDPVRPKVIAVRVKKGGEKKVFDFASFEITKFKKKVRIVCHEIKQIPGECPPSCIWLQRNFLDRQIVDINGKKLVRVRDIRLVMIPSGTYAIAVDVGMEGRLRRMRLDNFVQSMLEPLRITVPGKLILWDDIQAVDFTESQSMIKLSTSFARLHTLHASDLADIIEDMDKAARASLFASLDEEKAADVLEELEPKAQADLVESLPIEKMADLLEKMPADEAADLLDNIEEEKAIRLLDEMEDESSKEVRELLEYSDEVVGSIMTTDFHTFQEEMTVKATLEEIRRLQPEPSDIYSVFITDKQERLISSVSLMELVIARPEVQLREIMKKNPVVVHDHDKVDSLAELFSSYNLLSIPVINKDHQLEGVVVVEDIVEDLLNKRKTR